MLVAKQNIYREVAMSQYNNNTRQGKYKHLIESERYKIEGQKRKSKCYPFHIKR
jgi:hypothetical protein